MRSTGFRVDRGGRVPLGVDGARKGFGAGRLLKLVIVCGWGDNSRGDNRRFGFPNCFQPRDSFF